MTKDIRLHSGLNHCGYTIKLPFPAWWEGGFSDDDICPSVCLSAVSIHGASRHDTHDATAAYQPIDGWLPTCSDCRWMVIRRNCFDPDPFTGHTRDGFAPKRYGHECVTLLPVVEPLIASTIEAIATMTIVVFTPHFTFALLSLSVKYAKSCKRCT